MDRYTYISNAHGAYIEELYKTFLEAPESIDPSWKRFFEGFEFSLDYKDDATKTNGDDQYDQIVTEDAVKETRVRELIHGYRTRGHLKSDTNPIRSRRQHKVYLDFADFGLSEADLDEEFEVGSRLGIGKTMLEEYSPYIKKGISRTYWI